MRIVGVRVNEHDAGDTNHVGGCVKEISNGRVKVAVYMSECDRPERSGRQSVFEQPLMQRNRLAIDRQPVIGEGPAYLSVQIFTVAIVDVSADAVRRAVDDCLVTDLGLLAVLFGSGRRNHSEDVEAVKARSEEHTSELQS